MKAKFHIGLMSAMMLAGLPLNAQFADSRNYGDHDADLVINNYYDQDYYYSSRINRFHRAYTYFEYYSPVFTDTYWYSYRPYSWGISIYGRTGFSLGYSMNFPVYHGWERGYWYDYDYGWFNPYFDNSWYFGTGPFFAGWYSPVVININTGHRWRHDYYSWHGHDYYHGSRHVHNTYNNYYYNYSSPRYYSSGNNSVHRSGTSRESLSRRGTSSSSSTGPSVNRSNERTRTVERESRRDVKQSPDRVKSRNQQEQFNNGNNRNSRIDGNNGNFDRKPANTGNNGNNRNSRIDGNNGNFKQKPASDVENSRTRYAPETPPSTRERVQTGSRENKYSVPSRPASKPATAPSSARSSNQSRGQNSGTPGSSSGSVSKSTGGASKSSGTRQSSSSSGSSKEKRRR